MDEATQKVKVQKHAEKEAELTERFTPLNNPFEE